MFDSGYQKNSLDFNISSYFKQIIFNVTFNWNALKTYLWLEQTKIYSLKTGTVEEKLKYTSFQNILKIKCSPFYKLFPPIYERTVSKHLKIYCLINNVIKFLISILYFESSTTRKLMTTPLTKSNNIYMFHTLALYFYGNYCLIGPKVISY